MVRGRVIKESTIVTGNFAKCVTCIILILMEMP